MAVTRRFVYCDGWVYGPPQSPDPRVAGEDVRMGYAARSEDVPEGWVRLFAMLNEGAFAEGEDVAFTIHRDTDDDDRDMSQDPYDQLIQKLMELADRRMQATLLPIIDRIAALELRVAALEQSDRGSSLDRGHPQPGWFREQIGGEHEPQTRRLAPTAKQCRKDGHASLAKAESPTIAFTTEQACTCYADKGGGLVAWLVPTSAPMATNTPVYCGALTAGCWKQDIHFPSVPQRIRRARRWSSVFDVSDSFANDTATPVEALDRVASFDPENALLTQAVAALLNAATPTITYQLTTQQIIDQSNRALFDGATDTTSLSGTLFGFNEIECQLA